MKKLLLLSLLAGSLASCTVSKSGTSKTLDIVGPGVIQMPVVADLDVRSTKVSHSKTYSSALSKASSNIKADLVRELLRENQADVLIEPTYETVSKSGKVTLTVHGFPATYKNFRQVTREDLDLIEAAPKLLQKAESEESSVLTKKKQK